MLSPEERQANQMESLKQILKSVNAEGLEGLPLLGS